MRSARRVTPGFFPLDEELQLLAGRLTPRLQEQLTRLASWLPYATAATLLAAFTGVTVNEDYVRRHTQAAGAAQEALQTEAVAQLEREAPDAPSGPEQQYLSADGAFVPLVGGEWAEVKTVAIGEVEPPVWNARRAEWVAHTQRLSYFSRLADAESFTRLALVETQRRGVENATQVAAVQDGAEWLQGFVDHHRPDALRILDFPHAAGYVGRIGQATYGADTPELAAWLKTRLHTLKHAGPDALLTELGQLVQAQPQATALELPQALAYLEKRRAQLQYPAFQAQGWPIGSGATESGNKLVVEARLKGAGMHWARRHVNPMLALRNVVCNDRWEADWPQIAHHRRQLATAHRAARCQQRRESATARRLAAAPPLATPPDTAANRSPDAAPATAQRPPAPASGARRPAADHPWRHRPIGKARYRPRQRQGAAKT